MAWWFTPALMFGVSYYVRNKIKSAKVRWLNMPEAEAKKLPTIAAIAKSEGGEALPEPPEGYRWKPITLIYSASPFAPQSTFEVNVLESWLGNGAPTSQEVGGLHYFLTREYLQTAPRLGTPPRAPNESTGAAVLREAVRDMLRRVPVGGAAVTPIKPPQLQRGDLVVTRDCRIGRVISTPLVYGTRHVVALLELHPKEGQKIMVPYSDVQCAFGVRQYHARVL